MPYINQDLKDRESLQGWSGSLEEELNSFIAGLKEFNDDEVEGVLNYVISCIVSETLGKNGWRYRYINRSIGVLEAAKLEFYRRVASPYEDKAMELNGDIY